MVKVKVVVNDEKFNHQVASEAVTVFSSYDRKYVFRRSLNCLQENHFLSIDYGG